MTRFLVILMCLLGTQQRICAQSSASDSLALVALYNATGGANWTNRWNLAQPMTTWYGITLNAAGSVTCIDLDGVADCAYNAGAGNNLVGTLPNLRMASLQIFNVSRNSGITGTIPTLTMPLLETLNLGYNQLSGSVPNFNLPNLQYLYFNNNLLTGSIPNFNLPNLSIIYGQHNQLSGTMPRFDSTSLKYLYFDTNQLTGNVPNFTLQTLEDINFSNNQLTGSIPNFTIQSLTSIRLYNNRLTDTIPNFNLPNLKVIELHSNQLTGTIPNFAARGLINLLLNNNQLSGTIPNFNYPNLEYLHLYTNRLTGTIPTFTLPALKELLLYENQLTGTIPNFAMQNLLSLKLYNNQLTGSIPNFSMPLLTHIVLNTNQLSGTIPNFSMPNLVLLDLYKNQLSGTFPTGLSTILSTVKIDSNRFTFSHLIPNLTNLPTAVAKTYAPQDSIFSDTTYSKRVGDSLMIDLAIDNTLTSNFYTWYKNGNFYDTTRVNKLVINGLQLTNAGIYTCAVTNPNAPDLTLYSKKATVIVNAAVSACRAQDSLALVELYNTTGGANWLRNDNWLSSAPLNTWYGVFVNAQGCLDTLFLDNNRLSGVLPNSIGNLTNLRVLFLPNNQLNGNIPTSLGNLRELRLLYLHQNQFTGGIPTTFGNLTNLVELGLSNNPLQGTIPTSLGNLQALNRLYLGFDSLTGTIPTELGRMSALTDLYLDYNQLSGTIPTELSQLSNLQNLFLGNNGLSGTIPTELSRLNTLQYLFLDNNNLSGTIPDSLGQLSQLRGLAIDSNQLVGKIPVSFQRLTNLQSLHFHANQIDSVPSLANLPLRPDTTRAAGSVAVPNPRGLRIQQNQLTFDDIAPNYGFNGTATYVFAPQDSFFNDTTYRKRTGDTLIIDLKIDGALTNNNYNWYKNDTFFTSTTVNKLIINGLQTNHAGVYTCQVTNGTVDGFSLYSRKATVLITTSVPVVTPCRTRDSLALVALYNQNAVTALNRADLNWLTPNLPLENWANNGIPLTLSALGCVTQLDMSGLGLNGRLSDSIGNMTELEELHLQNNNLDSTLPNGLNRLTRLKVLLLSNNLLTGLPDSIWKLTNLTELDLDDNEIRGNIPSELGSLSRMRLLKLSKNEFTGTIPTTLGNLNSLQELTLSDNNLTDSIPSSLGRLRNLKILKLDLNQLTGKIPITFQQLRVLTELNFATNQLDSCPSLAALTNLISCNASGNRLTFNDILPNLGHRFNLNYAPQDSIFQDTTYQRSAGDALTIDLGIDNNVSNNVYKWYHNSILDTTIATNQLIINLLQGNDGGVYTCIVTNPNAPNLSLHSRKAIVNLNCAVTSQQRDTAICQGNAYTLPTGRVVMTAGTYRDTLRSRLLCDSIIITRLSMLSKDTTRLNLNDCTIAHTQTDTAVVLNRFGCDSIVIRTRTARRDSIERASQFTCRANEVGIRILSHSTNHFGCDSIEYQRVTLAPSYRRDTTIWRCNQPDQTVDSLYRTFQGCDSAVSFHYRLCRTDSTVIQHIVCNSRRDSIIRLRNFCGCDSTVIHKFNVPNLDTVLRTEVVCNRAYVGTTAVVMKHQRAPFCDSLVTITQRVFDKCGCLRDSTQLYTGLIPNDDDNQNDFFIIPLLEQYTPNELVITDKRGMLVYRTLNYRNNWGGTNQDGEPLPQGVYNFVFRTADCLRRGVIDIKYVP